MLRLYSLSFVLTALMEMEITSTLTAYAKDNRVVPSEKACHHVKCVISDRGGGRRMGRVSCCDSTRFVLRRKFVMSITLQLNNFLTGKFYASSLLFMVCFNVQ